MTTAPISLQDLRRRIYIKAKAEKTKRFWGLYVHVAKLETLRDRRCVPLGFGSDPVISVSFSSRTSSRYPHVAP